MAQPGKQTKGGGTHFLAIFSRADVLDGGRVEVLDRRHFQLPLAAEPVAETHRTNQESDGANVISHH